MHAAVAVGARSASGAHAAGGASSALPHSSHCRLQWAAWQQCGHARTERARRLPGGSGAVAAASIPERLTVTDRTPPPPQPEVEVRVIGIGSRGANAVSKLVEHGKVNAADVWCLDVDKAVLDVAPTANTLLLPKDVQGPSSEGRLSPTDLQRIVGRAASDAGGRGNINAGTDGAVTFVLVPAAAAPGGAGTVLQIVQALRAAGHFTVAAVTRPFAFEGAAKHEQADELIATLQQEAHMVAVMEQNVLMQAFGDAQMTVAEATDIADNALEHSVRCILQAVRAKEVLRSSRGALMWHGRDLRHFKRIISPPLQALLTQPGTAVLGRGLASMPAETAHKMGAVQALMHLASDAVRAAAESPFLDGALSTAGGVLCSINLPSTSQQFTTGNGGSAVLPAMQTDDGGRRAVHLAAQAAAGALGSMSGPWCDDYVLCAEPRPASETLGDGSLVQVEVTLLVLRLPEEHQRPACTARGTTSGCGAGQQQRYGLGPAVPLPPRQPPQAPQRLPASSWNMLSAMAGGAGTTSSKPAPAAHTAQPSASQVAPSPAAAVGRKSPPPPQQLSQVHRNIPNFFGGGAPPRQLPLAEEAKYLSQSQQQPAAAGTAASQRVPVRRPEGPAQAAGQTAAALHQPAGATVQGQQQEQQQRQQQRMTVGDYLVNSLTAQSLDLPPTAARWRQEHRGDSFRQRKLIVWEVDETEPWEEEEEPQGLAALLPGRRREKRINIKERMASILMQDREDAWEAESMDER